MRYCEPVPAGDIQVGDIFVQWERSPGDCQQECAGHDTDFGHSYVAIHTVRDGRINQVRWRKPNGKTCDNAYPIGQDEQGLRMRVILATPKYVEIHEEAELVF